MRVSNATEADFTAIVNLLKLSLGEGLLPKSERYWRWKHLENPFGESPVLLCWEGDVLIGVRAFMCWQWVSRGHIFKSVRAVDTATHPNHQGKGIFRKLTLMLLNSCNESGVDFVYNTPNNKSKPGYLKMGWQVAGTLPIAVKIRRPLGMMSKSFLHMRNKPRTIEDESIREVLEHIDLPNLLKYHLVQATEYITNTSVDYLKWRYLNVPVASYFSVFEESRTQLMFLIIGRIKETQLGRELRITDCFLNNGASIHSIRAKLKEKMKSWDIDYCTISGLAPNARRLLGSFSLKGPVGPSVTLRPLKTTNLSNFDNFNKWSPSIGDLELF